MIADNALDKLSVLVTRPAAQAEGFCRIIENAGGTALRFPVIAIEAIENNAYLARQFAEIEQNDIAIFISANAVHYAISYWPDELATSLKIAAVGKKTAASLHAQGISVDLLPKHGFNSEALLELPLLHKVQGKKIVIIRGIGGRDLLADTLRQRGAIISYIEVYQRVLPKHKESSGYSHQNCDIIAVTSQQGLRNLITLSDNKEQLFATALASNSQRTAELARELGFANDIIISAEPSDEAMATIIASWWQNSNQARPHT